jgi:hypothetical protein
MVETFDTRDRKIRLKRDPKPCKYFSKQYMLNVKMLPLNIQSKWEKEVHTDIVIEDWSFIYCIPFSVTKDTKLQDFQYKLIHRILNTNSFLYRWALHFVQKPKKVLFTFLGNVIMFGTFGWQLSISWKSVVLAYPLMQGHNSGLDWTQFSPGHNQQCFNYFEILYMSTDANAGPLI